MSVEISPFGHFLIDNVKFDCLGSYDNGNWTIMATWNGKGTVNASSLAKALTGITIIPGTSSKFPTITFTSASAELIPETSYSFSGKSAISWSKPFEVDVGLDIQNLGFTIEHQTSGGTNTLKATGEVSVKGSSSVDAACYFVNGSPVFILLDKIPAISWDNISSQFGLKLPPKVFNITFADNQIYYSKNTPDSNQKSLLPAGISAQKGLNFSSNVTLEFAGITFPSVDVNVNLAGSDVNLAGTFDNPIKLLAEIIPSNPDVLELTGNNYTGGPTISANLKSSKPNFGLACGLKLFGDEWGTVALTIKKENGHTEFTGNFTYPGTVFGVQNPKLGVSYTKSGGFQVTNMPAFMQDGLLALQTVLDAISYINNNECGPKGNRTPKKLNLSPKSGAPPFKPSFSITPHIKLTSAGIVLTISGTYTISVPATDAGGGATSGNGKNFPICSVPLPPISLTFQIPKKFSFQDIIIWARKIITNPNNIQTIVNELMQHRGELMQFLGVYVGYHALKAAINDVCDKEEEGEDPDPDPGPDEQPSDQQQLKDFCDVGEGILDAGGAPIAIVGGVATTIFGVLGGGFGISCDGGGGSSGGSSAPNVQPLPSPSLTKTYPYSDSAYPSEKLWEVSWPNVADAVYYQVDLYCGSPTPSTPLTSQVLLPVTSGNNKVHFQVPPVIPNYGKLKNRPTIEPPYLCKVVAVPFPGLETQSSPAKKYLKQVPSVPIVNIVSFDQETKTVICSFTKVSLATGYTATFIQKGHNSATGTLQPSGENFSVTFADLTYDPEATEFHISVIATAENWLPSAPSISTNTKPLELGIGHMTIGSTFIIH